MRIQKIRGHNRRHKQIEQWRQHNLELNFNLLEKYDYWHTDIDMFVHPWCDLSLVNSVIPYPKGMTKILMLSALLDIYDNWKKQLANYTDPYYLKIWLYEPHFSKSQVVCAIKDRINYYDNSFYRPGDSKSIIFSNYGTLGERLQKINWEYAWDENHFDNTEIEELSEHSWFRNLLKKSYRREKLSEPIGDVLEVYSFRQGEVWIGG